MKVEKERCLKATHQGSVERLHIGEYIIVDGIKGRIYCIDKYRLYLDNSEAFNSNIIEISISSINEIEKIYK